MFADRARSLLAQDAELLGTITVTGNVHYHLGVPVLVNRNVVPCGHISGKFRLALGIELHHPRDDIISGWQAVTGLRRRTRRHRDSYCDDGSNGLKCQFHNQNSNTNFPWKVRLMPLKNSPKRWLS